MRAKVAAALVAAAEGSGSAPSAAELARIRQFALEELAPEELYVRHVRLATDAVDRTWERLPRDYLERFAATLPGKPLLLGHDHQETPTGLWFQAAVREAAAGEPGEWVLEAGFYLRKSPANEEIRRQIDAGVIRYASIGFRYDLLVCDLCGGATARPGMAGPCDHWPGRLYDGQVATYSYGGDPERVEAHEGSLVYLGAQYGAELVKDAGADVTGGQGDGATGRPAKTGLSLPSSDPPVAPSPCRPVAPSLGDAAELIADGQAYRASLKAELVRLAGIVRAEAEAALLVAALDGQPAAKWLPVIASFQARLDALLPPAPLGEPLGQAGLPAAGCGRPLRLG
jgi:hypothetical protein